MTMNIEINPDIGCDEFALLKLPRVEITENELYHLTHGGNLVLRIDGDPKAIIWTKEQW